MGVDHPHAARRRRRDREAEGGDVMAFERSPISSGNPMEAVLGFSRAVRVGPFIAAGGTAPVDREGRTAGLGDVSARTRRCFEIVEAALVRARSGPRGIVRTRVILTGIEDWRAAIEVLREFRREARPLGTTMAVDRFVNRDRLAGIEVGAVVADAT